MNIDHQQLDDHQTRILIDHAMTSTRIYQFSDTHLQACAEDDPALPIDWIQDPKPVLPCSSEELLREHLERAVSLNADLILMVGDLFHFPSPENVTLAKRLFASCPVPIHLVPGNHDWFYPGMDGWEPLRRQMLPRLDSLFPHGSHMWVTKHNGLRIVGLDNSTYYLDREQAAFLEKQLRTEEPVLLMIHIPLSVPSMRPAVLEKFGAPLLMGDPEIDHESRKRPDVDLDATRFACELMRKSPNLVAVLAGHVHLSSQSQLSENACQYVAAAAYRGGHRLIQIQNNSNV